MNCSLWHLQQSFTGLFKAYLHKRACVHWKECLSSKATKLKVVNQSTFNHQCYVAEVMMPYFTTEHISSLLTKNPTKFPKQLLLSAIQILFEFSETTTPLKQTISARTRAHISLQQRPYWAPSRQGGNLISLRQGRVSAAPHMCTRVVYHGERASERWKSQLGTGERGVGKPFILLRNEGMAAGTVLAERWMPQSCLGSDGKMWHGNNQALAASRRCPWV